MDEKPKSHRYPTKTELQRVVTSAVKKAVSEELRPLKKDVAYLMGKDHDEGVISEYLRKHPEKKTRSELSNTQWLNRELIKIIIYILAIVLALIGGPKIWH